MHTKRKHKVERPKENEDTSASSFYNFVSTSSEKIEFSKRVSKKEASKNKIETENPKVEEDNIEVESKNIECREYFKNEQIVDEEKEGGDYESKTIKGKDEGESQSLQEVSKNNQEREDLDKKQEVNEKNEDKDIKSKIIERGDEGEYENLEIQLKKRENLTKKQIVEKQGEDDYESKILVRNEFIKDVEHSDNQEDKQ